MDCSSIVVNNGSTFLFNNNKASSHGGAIFVESCSLEQIGGSSCFIQHSNSALHPDDWNISVTFSGNQQQKSNEYKNNSIYMDTINSCIWPGSVENMRHNTFCWRGWSYFDTEGVTDDCLTLQSGPASMNTTLPTNYSLYPGQLIDLLNNFTVYDAWEHNMTQDANLQLDIISGNVQNFPFCQFKGVETCDASVCRILPNVEDGADYAHIHTKILVHPPQLTGIVLDLSFKPCENGSTFTPNNGCTHPVLRPYYTTCYNTTTNSRCNTYFYTDCTRYPVEVTIAGGLHVMCGRCAADGYKVAFNLHMCQM